MIELEFHPEAERELLEAAAWYRSRQKLLADEYLDELTKVLNLVQHFPKSGSEIDGPARRILFHRFPYAVIYRQQPEKIQIFAIAHLSRKPGFWATRKF